jgi:hypothetical protein
MKNDTQKDLILNICNHLNNSLDKFIQEHKLNPIDPSVLLNSITSFSIHILAPLLISSYEKPEITADVISKLFCKHLTEQISLQKLAPEKMHAC